MSFSTGGNILTDMQPLSLPDLTGEHYTEVLKRLHRELRPQSYLEIGTLHAQSLRLANCPSIAIDPDFSQAELNGIVGTKGLCALYQMTSDTNDLQKTLDELGKRSGTSAMVLTDTMAPGTQAHIYEAITPVVTPKH